MYIYYHKIHTYIQYIHTTRERKDCVKEGKRDMDKYSMYIGSLALSPTVPCAYHMKCCPQIQPIKIKVRNFHLVFLAALNSRHSSHP